MNIIMIQALQCAAIAIIRSIIFKKSKKLLTKKSLYCIGPDIDDCSDCNSETSCCTSFNSGSYCVCPTNSYYDEPGNE